MAAQQKVASHAQDGEEDTWSKENTIKRVQEWEVQNGPLDAVDPDDLVSRSLGRPQSE